jgi:hypothetical protein
MPQQCVPLGFLSPHDSRYFLPVDETATAAVDQSRGMLIRLRLYGHEPGIKNFKKIRDRLQVCSLTYGIN